MECDPAVGEVAEFLDRTLHIQQQHDDDDAELFSKFEFGNEAAGNLVSAMKGGRGGPRKLRVSWAPQVYDPIPTSVSHTLTSNNKKKKNDKDKAKKKKKKKKKKHSSSSLMMNMHYSPALSSSHAC